MPSSKEYQRTWRAKNPGYASRKSKEYYARNPDSIRRQNLKANYGLTPEQYDQMYAQQNGRCASCKDPGKLCVDHNHGTGAVRALLCSHCNTAFGHLREDALRIRALAEYAERFQTVRTV